MKIVTVYMYGTVHVTVYDIVQDIVHDTVHIYGMMT